MRRLQALRVLLACAVFSVALPWSGADPVWAQDEEAEEQEKESRWKRQEEDPFAKLPQASAKIRERYEKALSFYFNEKYDEAEQELGKVFMNRLNPAEVAMIHEAYAYVANARGDRKEARRRLLAAVETVDSGGLRPDKALDLGYQVAMLYVQDQMWKEAADAQEQWFSGAKQAASVGLASAPNARSYYMLALTYYQLEDYEKALKPAETAVEKGDPPAEGWLQLLLGIRLIEKQYKEAIPVLEKLISNYPAKGHFMNLSTVYGALGELGEAALPLQLAHVQGYLDQDSDLRRVAQLLLFLNLPFRSAEILEKGIEDGLLKADTESLGMLANSWIGAREFEKAVGPLEQAASLAKNGELYVRLAQVHIQRENWPGATSALRKGIDKGGLLDPGDANLLMGIAYYSQQKRQEARRWFVRAKGFEKTRAEASVWVTHVDQELAQLAAAAAAEAEAEAEADAEAAGG